MAIEKVIDIKIQGNVDQVVGSLRSQLKEAQADVAKLSEKFGVTSIEATNAAKRAGELKDRIGDAKALTDAFNPDAKFKALTSSLSGVAGGFAALQGGMSLFGSQSEEVEKTLLKVQSAMALSMGLQAIGESIDSFNQLNAVIQSTTAYQKINSIATVTATAVQKLLTGAVNTTAVSFKALKTAIVSTGIGALVVGIGYLISKLNESADATEELTKEQERLNIQLEYTKKLTDDNAKAIDYSTQIALANAKKRGASEKELLKIQLDAYEAKGKANNKEIEDIQKTQSNQYNLTKEQNKRIQDLREQNIELQRQGNVAIANLDANFAEKQRGNSERLSEQQKAQRKKDLEDLKSALQAQRDARQTSIDEVTQAIGDAQDKQNEFLGTAEEAEEQKVKDKYFKLLELAKQQNRSEEELWVLKDARDNELNDIRLANQKKQYDKEQEARKEAADKEIALDLAVKNAKRDALDTGLNILMQFAGKNKAIALGILAVQKGLAIADIVVGSAKSISAATSALAAVPAVIGVVPNPMYAVQAAATLKGIALTKITAATSIASILASTITSAKGITGGGGATAPSMGGDVSGGGTTAPQFNIVGNTGANQIAQTLAGQNQQPIQTYVVASNVTTAQSLDRNIISNASIG